MLVVAGTSPLDYQVWTGLSDHFPSLFRRVVVPPEVIAELSAADAHAAVRAWAGAVPP